MFLEAVKTDRNDRSIGIRLANFLLDENASEVANDRELGLEWLRWTGAQGNREAMLLLGRHLPDQSPERLRWLIRMGNGARSRRGVYWIAKLALDVDAPMARPALEALVGLTTAAARQRLIELLKGVPPDDRRTNRPLAPTEIRRLSWSLLEVGASWQVVHPGLVFSLPDAIAARALVKRCTQDPRPLVQFVGGLVAWSRLADRGAAVDAMRRASGSAEEPLLRDCLLRLAGLLRESTDPAHRREARVVARSLLAIDDGLGNVELGRCLMNGVGGPRDLLAARECFVAALAKIPPLTVVHQRIALRHLGDTWALANDPKPAELAYERGIALGDRLSKVRRATLFLFYGKPEEGERLLFELSAEGIVEAAKELGFRLRLGWQVKRNPAKARELLARGAQEGRGLDMAHLGGMLRHGEGGVASPGKARSWLRRAAELGQRRGLWELGEMQMLGEGGARDVSAGLANLTRAAKLGEGQAKLALGRHYLGLDGDAARATGLRWVKRAGKRPSAEGAARLAEFWRKDDPTSARSFAKSSAEREYVGGMVLYGDYLLEAVGGDADPAAARKWYLRAQERGALEAAARLRRLE
jgi:TPR repeat protein